MKWLRNIKKKKKKKKKPGKTYILILRSQEGLELKLEALTGGTLQSVFNHFAKFTVKHLC